MEKICNNAKQLSGSSDLAKGVGTSSGEVDTTIGLESQPKSETDNPPTLAGASKNPLLRMGILFCSL